MRAEFVSNVTYRSFMGDDAFALLVGGAFLGGFVLLVVWVLRTERARQAALEQLVPFLSRWGQTKGMVLGTGVDPATPRAWHLSLQWARSVQQRVGSWLVLAWQGITRNQSPGFSGPSTKHYTQFLVVIPLQRTMVLVAKAPTPLSAWNFAGLTEQALPPSLAARYVAYADSSATVQRAMQGTVPALLAAFPARNGWTLGAQPEASIGGVWLRWNEWETDAATMDQAHALVLAVAQSLKEPSQ